MAVGCFTKHYVPVKVTANDSDLDEGPELIINIKAAKLKWKIVAVSTFATTLTCKHKLHVPTTLVPLLLVHKFKLSDQVSCVF